MEGPRYKDHAGIESGFGNSSREVQDTAYVLRDAIKRGARWHLAAWPGMAHEVGGSYFWMKNHEGTLFRVKVEKEVY